MHTDPLDELKIGAGWKPQPSRDDLEIAMMAAEMGMRGHCFPVLKDRVVEPRKLVSKQKAKARRRAQAQRKARKVTRRAG